MITLEIYPESKKVLLSFLHVCFAFTSDMDYAKHDKRANKNSFCQTVFLECRKSTRQDQLCVMDFFTHVKLFRFFSFKPNISLAARLIMANLVNMQSFIRIRCKVSKI